MVNQLYKEAHQYDWLKDIAYSVTATIAGFGTTVINNVTGLELRNAGVFENYEKSYYGGAIAGNIASTILGAIETVVGPLMTTAGMLGTGGGTLATATGVGVGPGIAITGVSVAVTAAGAGVTGTGVATLDRSGSSLSDNIQNFKDSGTSESNKPSSNVNSNKLNHIFEKEEHNLNHFLESYGGNQEKAYQAIEKATQQYIDTNKISDGLMQEVINVKENNITVRGNVINGKINIGTAYIAP